jgi:hypothetical protein
MQISILAVVLSAVAAMAIGFVWYSMSVFGKPWMEESGLTMEKIGNGPGVGYMLVTLTSALTGAMFSFFATRLGVKTVVEGLTLAVLLWVGFVATSYAATYVFSQKSLKLYLIDTGYYLSLLLAVGVIVGLIM